MFKEKFKKHKFASNRGRDEFVEGVLRALDRNKFTKKEWENLNNFLDD